VTFSLDMGINSAPLHSFQKEAKGWFGNSTFLQDFGDLELIALLTMQQS